MKWVFKQNGFTIVELLIVVVVISILAAISIVSYNGITNRAAESKRASDFSQYKKKIESAKITSGTETYPSSLADTGISQSSKYVITYGATSGGKGYCLDVSEDYGVTAYFITHEATDPLPGFCGTMDGLVAWWPLNGSTRDLTLNGNDGQATGLVDAPGVQGGSRTAYTFNGSTSQIICGTNSVLRPTSAVTVTAWVYVTGIPASLAGIVNNGTQGYTLSMASNSSLRWNIQNTTKFGPTLDSGQWYMVYGTYDTGANRQGYLTNKGSYGSGSSGGTTGTGTLSNYGSDVCQIGSIRNTSGSYFNGRIDDVRIYNRALSDDEIRANAKFAY